MTTRSGRDGVREQLYFEDVQVGSELASLTVSPEPSQLFFFSAATYNGHRIHYDRRWAVDVEGYSDILVQGPLQSALLARLLTDWAGGAGRLVEYSFQHRGSAYPGDELRFSATVVGKRPPTLIDLAVRGDRLAGPERGPGELLMPGTATVVLPTRNG